jgi:hypothetical protein
MGAIPTPGKCSERPAITRVSLALGRFDGSDERDDQHPV